MTKPETINVSNTLGIRLVPSIDPLSGLHNPQNLYVSHSPKYQSAAAEGSWEDWVTLAKEILSYDAAPVGVSDSASSGAVAAAARETLSLNKAKPDYSKRAGS